MQVTPAAAAATLAAVTSPLFVVFAAVFVPLAMILFGLNLSALSIAFKWAVAGRVVPGVHKCVLTSCMLSYAQAVCRTAYGRVFVVG